MIIQYPAHGDFVLPNLDDLAARAVEGQFFHSAVETSTADAAITLAAPGTQVDVGVVFSKPFSAAPAVMLTLAGAGNAGVYINVLAVNVTTTGFTLRAVSGAAQTISCRWIAYGRRQ